MLGRAPAAARLEEVQRLMRKLKLPVNERKTRCLRCPEEPFEFLGYRLGRNYRLSGKGPYSGTRPSKASVQSIGRKSSEWTAPRSGQRTREAMVERLNRCLTGWAHYFHLGQVSPAYNAIDRHAVRRLRQWLCRKHKVKSGQYVLFPDARLYGECGLVRLTQTTKSLPWAKA